MSATPAFRRIQKELGDLRAAGIKSFRDVQVDDANLLCWHGLIVPDNAPYNKGAFKIEIKFPPEYPFKPPIITFKTKIYHPNVDERGKVCLNIISANIWKPTTKIDQVILALICMVNDPEPDHPMRPDLAEEFLRNRPQFMKTAEEHTKNFSERRPSI